MPFTCFDRVLPLELRTAAERVAPTRTGAAAFREEAYGFPERYWPPGTVVGVRFLDGSPGLQRRVLDVASTWSQHANIRFERSTDAAAPIRVSFESAGSWSALGTECLVAEFYPTDGPTMSLSELRGEDDPELERTTLHEFGHALGLLHEHENPSSGIEWDKQAVYDAMSVPPNNWTKAMVEQNFFGRYAESRIRYTAFDPDSIMIYAMPPAWTKARTRFPTNRELSPADVAFIAAQYP